MKDHAGRIDHPSQRVALVLLNLSATARGEFAESLVQARGIMSSFADFLPDAKQHGSHGANHAVARFNLNHRGETGIEQKIVERGQQAIQAA